MLRFSSRGSFDKTGAWLHDLRLHNVKQKLEKYGQKGVDALSAATPKDTGLTAASWSYEIRNNQNELEIVWKNSNVVNGYPIAVLIQYGHGTRNGGYVQGLDYINPTMKPIFDEIVKELEEEIKKL